MNKFAMLAATLRRRLTRHRALRRQAAEFRRLAEHSGDMVARLSLDGRCRYVSAAAGRILGRGAASLLGQDFAELALPEDRPMLRQALAGLLQAGAHTTCISLRARHADGRELWLEASLGLLRAPRYGLAEGVVATVRDVTERKAAEVALAALAHSDELTGLANRRRLEAALEAAWRRCGASGEPLTLMLVDIDRFKAFNDGHGHLAGDAALRGVAVTLGSAVRRERDLVGRFGGEEFLVLLPGTPAAEAEAIAERLRGGVEALGLAHASRGAGLGVITVSIGLATETPGGEPGAGIALLLAAADRALYAAKRGGRNRVAAAALLARPLVDA